MDQKYYLWQEEEDGLVHPVLDSLDNYKMLSERMNVLTIYLHRRKIGIASNLSNVKTAVNMHTCNKSIKSTINYQVYMYSTRYAYCILFYILYY